MGSRGQVDAVQREQLSRREARREGRGAARVHHALRIQKHSRGAQTAGHGGRLQRHAESQVGTDSAADTDSVAHHVVHGRIAIRAIRWHGIGVAVGIVGSRGIEKVGQPLMAHDGSGLGAERAVEAIQAGVPGVQGGLVLVESRLIVQAAQVGRARPGAHAHQQVGGIGRPAENEVAVGRKIQVVLPAEQRAAGVGERHHGGATAEDVFDVGQRLHPLARPVLPGVPDNPHGAQVARAIGIHAQHGSDGVQRIAAGEVHVGQGIRAFKRGCGGQRAGQRRGDEHVVIAVEVFRAAAHENTLRVDQAVDRIAGGQGIGKEALAGTRNRIGAGEGAALQLLRLHIYLGGAHGVGAGCGSVEGDGSIK